MVGTRIRVRCLYQRNESKPSHYEITPGRRLCTSCLLLCQPVLNGSVKFKPNYQSLVQSARECLLCQMFVDALDAGGHGEHLRRDSEVAGGHRFDGMTIGAEVLEPYEINTVPTGTPSMDRMLAEQARRRRRIQTRDQMLNLRCTGIFADGTLYEANVVWCLKDPVASQPHWTHPLALSLSQRLDTVASWLTDCVQNHPQCNSFPNNGIPMLPTRVIVVGTDSSQSSPRLLVSNGLRSEYVALSHRWGATRVLETTRDNLNSHLGSIPMISLSQTFRDAVIITRKLGFRYLWIDSLCIVQGDQGDWEAEAAKMASVYQNASVTIAATHAADGTVGCLSGFEAPLTIDILDPPQDFVRPMARTRPFTQRLTSMLRRVSSTRHRRANQASAAGANSQSATPRQETIYLRKQPCEWASIQQAPLNERGWVLQESVLSHRTIHFAKDQIYWSCLNRVKSEDGVLDCPSEAARWTHQRAQPPSASLMLYNPLIAAEALYISWFDIIKDFSHRSLSQPKDRFAALAGVTTAFMKKLGDEPLAGLWKNDIVAGLLWKAKAPSRPVDPLWRSIPSWSWTSLDAPIGAPECRQRNPDYRRVHPKLELTDNSLSWSRLELTSMVKQGLLSVRGRLKMAMIDYLDLNIAGTHWAHLASKANDISETVLIRATESLDGNFHVHRRAALARMAMTTSPPPDPGVGICTLDRQYRPGRDDFVHVLEVMLEDNSLHGEMPGMVTTFCRVLILEKVQGFHNRYRRLGVGYLYHDKDKFDGFPVKDITLI